MENVNFGRNPDEEGTTHPGKITSVLLQSLDDNTESVLQ